MHKTNSTTDRDTIPRYAPDSVMTLAGMRPVTRYTVHPSGKFPANCPIRKDLRLVALECSTCEGPRWYGFSSAYINSELRIVVVGFNKRFEEVSNWEVCEIQ